MLNEVVSTSNTLPVAVTAKVARTETSRPIAAVERSETEGAGVRDGRSAVALAPPGSEDTRGLEALVQSSTDEDAAGLSEAEQSVVRELAARDREVRDHEQAHARVGGQYAGEPTYIYQTGPDGRSYAVGGAVSIDTAPVRNDPQATIQKMEIVKSAALAPAEPSAADRRIAALAEAQKLQAIGDLRAAETAEQTEPPAREEVTSRSGRVEAFLEMLAALTEPVRNPRSQLDLVT